MAQRAALNRTARTPGPAVPGGGALVRLAAVLGMGCKADQGRDLLAGAASEFGQLAEDGEHRDGSDALEAAQGLGHGGERRVRGKVGVQLALDRVHGLLEGEGDGIQRVLDGGLDGGCRPAAFGRQWLDQQGVDVIMDVPTSSVALGVNTVCREKNKAYINTGGATADLTGKDCTPVTVHWSYDTYMLAASTAGSLPKQGANSWFFVTADYVFGHQLQRDSTAVVEKNSVKVIGLANAGADTVNCVKQAHEFGLTQGGTRLAALLGSLGVIHALGLPTAQGLLLTESFYWDMNDRTRAFMARVRPRRRPTTRTRRRPPATPGRCTSSSRSPPSAWTGQVTARRWWRT